jgi:hypothetical protein
MKARLNEAHLDLPKTHDLEQLLDLLAAVEPLWLPLRTRLKQLTKYAVRVRYLGFSADRTSASKAFDICTELRDLARSSLGLNQ